MPGAMTTVLVVEDDPFQRQAVQQYLRMQGMDVTAVEDAGRFRAAVEVALPDVALLDVGLPGGEDGFSLARWLRARSPQVAIIMLTAASDLVDRVVGLESGADDYLTKPFEPRELLARVKAVLRRSGVGAGGGTIGAAGAGPAGPPAGPAAAPTAWPPAASDCVAIGIALLHVTRRVLLLPDGAEEPLTPSEFALLRLLTEHPNRPLQRDWLLEATSETDEPEAFDRAIDLRIMRLRRKVERNPARPEAIRTVRGVGYMFVPPGG
jgi:two-component system phosphate regulon response regulator OmpR